ncbi:hypothetical protein BDA99DRAFT_543360 [Phascolomyces articulosus]|uniref:Uncharacterized protein n=1 Tax=Phascolomyces articulosus TaxID=60185 RepID=A0AAD5JZ17_9FUNG|nr:hypothetical protein BDA99DRAFT_543360 [Phascolomyces articulosus]
MRDHTNSMNHQLFDPMMHHHQYQLNNTSSSSTSEQGRRQSAPIIISTKRDGGVNLYHHPHHRSPHFQEEKPRQKRRPRHQHHYHPTSLPPPPKLFIAEQFMASSSSYYKDNTKSLEQQMNALNKKGEQPALRLSIAEQFMIKKKPQQGIQEQETKKNIPIANINNNNNSDNDDEKNPSMIRSISGFSRLLSSFHLEMKSHNNNDNSSKVSLDSVSTPSSDGRPVAKFDHHHRQQEQYDLQQQQQQQQQRSVVRPYQSKTHHFRTKCHCQCDGHHLPGKPKYLDIIEEKNSCYQQQTNQNNRNKKNSSTHHQNNEEEEKASTSDITDTTSRRKRKRRTTCVITTFIILIAGAITVFLTWPRTPLFRIDGGATLLEPPTLTETHHINADNVAFESTWSLMATLDNRQNYIPLHFSMETIVKQSGTIIGRSSNTPTTQQRQNVVLSPRTISQMNIPVHIDYEARQASDPIFSSLRRACVENTHEALQLQFWITLYIAGLEWTGYHPSIVATPATGGFLCPSLSNNI